MQANVFTDKRLERYAGRFVWLSIDTESAAAAPFLKKFPIRVLPTLLVIDGASESVALRYAGGATVTQLTRLLVDGERMARGKATANADALLAAADKLSNEGKHGHAAKLYDEAIRKGAKGWSRRSRAAESMMMALTLANDHERCMIRGGELLASFRGTSSGANIASLALGCAANVDAKNSARAAALDRFEKGVREALADPKISLSDDDRSGFFESLAGAREAMEDKEGARKVREEWAAFLEGAAARAQTPQQRTVFDSHRVSVYLALGTPEKAIPMLQQSERDFPDDYNPPARLALAYRAMKDLDRALAASDRALARVYGPRKLNVLRVRTDIYLDRGDKEAARRTIQEAIQHARSLPEGQRSDRTIAAWEKRLTEIAQ